MSNYTTTPVGGDRLLPAPPEESVDDLADSAERAALLAELTLERFSPFRTPAKGLPHRGERAVIRRLERGARRARRAAKLARFGAAASSGRGPHRAADLSEAGL